MDRLLISEPLTVFEQMALDETLVRRHDGGFWLRIYSWTSGPAVTFGYAQFFDEVTRELSSRGFTGPAVRRPTGGGVVWHEEDLTFSCIWSTPLLRVSEIYAQLHGHIESALQRQGLCCHRQTGELPASAYAPSVRNAASACFTSPVESDLLQGGEKILGGAIRRFGQTLLYQGSLQTTGARENPACRRAVIDAMQNGFGLRLQPQRAPQDWLQEARALAVSQYQTPAWNRKF